MPPPPETGTFLYNEPTIRFDRLPSVMTADLKYLLHYPPAVLDKVRALIDEDRLEAWLAARYADRHAIQTDAALYDYVNQIRQRHLKNAPPLSRVAYDSRQHPVHGTLGTNTRVARVQGSRLKTKHEIRVATLFRDTAPAFLRMIAVHELAHLKEREHTKAFYQLCQYMEPDYHQLEFDLRLYLTWQDIRSSPD
ncbi:YgjP-like metallopeptidase domain-containing protein [Paludibacterium paludis]|uniref:YgjP-like metallopeptidase domain-containing protein n=1 Tax=Paludibacterium paludis TaxID=1225769 RepID=A0A918P5Y8_9NEIS|nr:YgjP-like metallopeptidase domain-containing protein [Paludibacterium paludis]GGY23686.1 hypothetical protein GCM10011289_29180 [Paludibacterium paludis]